jgi:hypothetical protein
MDQLNNPAVFIELVRDTILIIEIRYFYFQCFYSKLFST